MAADAPDPPALAWDDFVTCFDDPAIGRVFEHWDGLRRSGGLPRRADLDPAAIGRDLPMVFIAEHLPDDRWRLRLVGTALRRIFGRDVTGQTLDELFEGPMLDSALGAYEAIRRDGRPQYVEMTLPADTGVVYFYRRLLLPMTHADGTVGFCLGVHALDFAKRYQEGTFFELLTQVAGNLEVRTRTAAIPDTP